MNEKHEREMSLQQAVEVRLADIYHSIQSIGVWRQQWTEADIHLSDINRDRLRYIISELQSLLAEADRNAENNPWPHEQDKTDAG